MSVLDALLQFVELLFQCFHLDVHRADVFLLLDQALSELLIIVDLGVRLFDSPARYLLGCYESLEFDPVTFFSRYLVS
jgi:hypothetical protein